MKNKKQVAEVGLASALCVSVTYGLGYFNKIGPKLSGLENTLVIFISDLLRVLVCFILRSILESNQKMSYPKEYLIFGGLSFFQSLIWLFSFQNLFVFILQIVANTRSIFVFLLSLALLKKKYSFSKWLAQIFLLFGIIFPFTWEVLVEKKISLNNEYASEKWIYPLLIILSCLSSAFSSVYFEMTVKKRRILFWTNSLYYSGSGLVVSLIYLVISIILRENRSIALFGKISILVLFKVLEGFIYSYIMINYSAIVKPFMQLVLNCIISIFMSLHLKEPIPWYRGVSLGIIVFAVIIFNIG